MSALQDIVRFLTDRLDEDSDEIARLRRTARFADSDSEREQQLLLAERLNLGNVATRHLIGHLQALFVHRDLPAERAVRELALHSLRALAHPYAGHRSYHAEWDVTAEPPPTGNEPLSDKADLGSTANRSGVS